MTTLAARSPITRSPRTAVCSWFVAILRQLPRTDGLSYRTGFRRRSGRRRSIERNLRSWRSENFRSAITRENLAHIDTPVREGPHRVSSGSPSRSSKPIAYFEWLTRKCAPGDSRLNESPGGRGRIGRWGRVFVGSAEWWTAIRFQRSAPSELAHTASVASSRSTRLRLSATARC